MTCQDCLAGYSEYLDGVLASDDEDRFRVHLERCPSCARYHAVMQRGLSLVREIPALQPPSDFHARMQHRIFHVQDEDLRRGSRLGTPATALSIDAAGLIAFAALGPFARNILPRASGAATVAVEEPSEPATETWPLSPERIGVMGGGGGWVHIGERRTRIGAEFEAPHGIGHVFPGPYSPLIIEPPRVGGRRDGRVFLAAYLNSVD
jgi:hypothetical protein